MTPVEIARLDALAAPEWHSLANVTFLLPAGSTEQHGPHLPAGTDTTIAVAVCERACSKGEDLVLVPPIPYGVSDHHKQLPGGAVSAGAKPFAAYLGAVVSELVNPARSRAVVVVNGHGGNWPSIVFALDELGAARGELPVGACSWWDLVADAIEDVDPNVPGLSVGHAGAVETSIMLALEPDAVRADRRDPPPHSLRRNGPRLHRWLDFSRHFDAGIIGTPSLADPGLGRSLVAEAADRLVTLARSLRA
jgi:creatinine amidohydrolase